MDNVIQIHSPGNDCSYDISFKVLEHFNNTTFTWKCTYFTNQRIYCSNNLLKYWGDLSKWMPPMKASNFYTKKSPRISWGQQKETEIGVIACAENLSQLMTCRFVKTLQFEIFLIHIVAYVRQLNISVSKTNMMVNLPIFWWKFQVFKSKPQNGVLKLLSGEYFSVDPYLTTTSAEP